MKTLMLLAIMLVPEAFSGGFSGVWVDDLDTQTGRAGFDKYLVAHGTYECASCSPPARFRADAKLHPTPVNGSPVFQSVAILGPRTIMIKIIEREMYRQTTMTVAPDDRTATFISFDKWPEHKKLLRTEYFARRTAPAPEGANAVSGSWQGVRYISVPEEYRSVRP